MFWLASQSRRATPTFGTSMSASMVAWSACLLLASPLQRQPFFEHFGLTADNVVAAVEDVMLD